jgi:S-adenosyl methyltransferase
MRRFAVSYGDSWPSGEEAEEDDAPSGLNITVPVSARIWNYWMGGKDHYQVDRTAGDEFAALYPGIRDMARASRLFLGRVVSFLAEEAGIRQFLDIGTGLPGNENTHEVAQRQAPGSRVVYVDNDPQVMAHARALLTGATPEVTDYIDGDLNDPEKIIAAAKDKLDFTRPVAIMLMGILGHISNPDENGDGFALSVVEHLKAALPVGGYLVIRDATDTVAAHVQALRAYEQTGAVPYRLRSPAQIARFFDGLEPVEPGIVPIQQWRPDGKSSRLPADINMDGGVAIRR